MASTADMLLTDFQNTQAYLRSQRSVLKNGDAFVGVLAQQAELWKDRLEKAHFTSSEGNTFTRALEHDIWGDAHITALATALGSAVAKGQRTKGGRRPNQTLTVWNQYFSQKDCAVFSDTSATLVQKCDVVASRLFKLNIHLPTEQTVKRALLCAMNVGDFGKAGSESYMAVREIKRLLKQRVKTAVRPGNFLVEYPLTPLELPESLRAKAHPQGDPPCQIEVDESLSCVVPLRKTNKGMDGSSQHSQSHSQSSSQAEVMAQTFMNVMAMMQQGSGVQLPGLTLFKPKTKAAKALGDAAPATPATPTAGDQTDSQETLEHQNLPVAAASSKPAPLALPAPSTLVVPKPLELPPAHQVETVLDSIKERTAGKKRAAEDETSATEASKQPKGNAKCKAKAAPKSTPKAKSIGKAKAKASGKAKAKKPSEVKADANEQPAADHHQQETAIGGGKPPCPSAPGLGTTFFRGGKIQYPKNGKELRVFRKVTDRNDLKVKIRDGSAEAAWEKALRIIEDAGDVD